MDYGTVDEVLKDRVRFLSKEFAHLPPLSVRGCLDHVRPKDGVWTLNALEAFMLKVVKADATPTLAAHITAVNQEVGIDTSKSYRNVSMRPSGFHC